MPPVKPVASAGDGNINVSKLSPLIFFSALTFASVAWADGGFADIFRSVTGALSGHRQSEPRQTSTATIGIRGIDDVDPDHPSNSATAGKDLQLIDSWAASRGDAASTAKAKHLFARAATLGNPGNASREARQ